MKTSGSCTYIWFRRHGWNYWSYGSLYRKPTKLVFSIFYEETSTSASFKTFKSVYRKYTIQWTIILNQHTGRTKFVDSDISAFTLHSWKINFRTIILSWEKNTYQKWPAHIIILNRERGVTSCRTARRVILAHLADGPRSSRDRR